VIDDETAAFLATGCALVVATVGPDGEPFVTRGWGATVLSAERMELRLILDAGPDPAVAQLAEGGRIAITATSVPTLHSVQLKGRAQPPVQATARDRAKVDQYCADFFGDIVATDHADPALPPRLRPRDFMACTVEVEDLFDQTPGPKAGSAVGTGPR
jgi:hypothetical protein